MWFLKASAIYNGILFLADLYCAYRYPCFFTVFNAGFVGGIWSWMMLDFIIERVDEKHLEEGEDE